VVPLAELTRRVEQLDAKLRPIATRPIKFDDVSARATIGCDPLGEAGVRAEGVAVVRDLIDAYASGDDPVRQTIRNFMAENTSFTWAATLPCETLNLERLRNHVLLFSM